MNITVPLGLCIYSFVSFYTHSVNFEAQGLLLLSFFQSFTFIATHFHSFPYFKMRAAGLSAFAAFLGLHTFGVQGETSCHIDRSVTNRPIVDLSKVHKALAGPVAKFCTKSLEFDSNQKTTTILLSTTPGT